jgi:hypothetical protein
MLFTIIPNPDEQNEAQIDGKPAQEQSDLGA